MRAHDPLPPALLALGAFDVAEAARHGVTIDRLRRAVGRADLANPARGWYATPPGDDALAGYRLRGAIASRTLGLPLSHVSALVALGLPAYALRDRPVYLVGPPPGVAPAEGSSSRRHGAVPRHWRTTVASSESSTRSSRQHSSIPLWPSPLPTWRVVTGVLMPSR